MHLEGKIKRSALTVMLLKLVKFVNVTVYVGCAGKSGSFLMFTALCSLFHLVLSIL